MSIMCTITTIFLFQNKPAKNKKFLGVRVKICYWWINSLLKFDGDDFHIFSGVTVLDIKTGWQKLGPKTW